MEELNEKLNKYFAGKVVRKDLTKKIKEGANVPVYVLEYLLGMYCATNDEQAINDGVETVKRILADNFVRPDEAEKIKSKIKEQGVYTIIDKITKAKEKLTDEEVDFIISNEDFKMYKVSEEQVRKAFSNVVESASDLPNCGFVNEKVIKEIIKPMKEILSKNKFSNEDLALLYNYKIEFNDAIGWANEQIDIISNKMSEFREKLLNEVAYNYLYLYSKEVDTDDRNIALDALTDAKKILETKVSKDSKMYTEALQILNKIEEILHSEEISRKDYLEAYNNFVDFYDIVDE